MGNIRREIGKCENGVGVARYSDGPVLMSGGSPMAKWRYQTKVFIAEGGSKGRCPKFPLTFCRVFPLVGPTQMTEASRSVLGRCPSIGYVYLGSGCISDVRHEEGAEVNSAVVERMKLG